MSVDHTAGKRDADFDEAGYLAANPDVAAAVASGQFESGRAHYESYGRQEGRALGAPAGIAAAEELEQSAVERWRAEQIRYFVSQIRSCTPGAAQCPICGYSGYFRPSGWPVRMEAMCPRCGSLERHRTVKLWLDANSDQLRNKRILHFAAEAAIANVLRPLAAEYVTAEIDGSADLTLDIEQIALPDGRFDVVFCSHVLEHVDDRKALREIRRILSPRGLAILLIPPIVEGWTETYEDPAITTAADRERRFGQADHVRIYGTDFRERVRRAGFSLKVVQTGRVQQYLIIGLFLVVTFGVLFYFLLFVGQA